MTTAANAVIRLHDRMPVILEDSVMREWLVPGPIPQRALDPYPADRMRGWQVGPHARNSRLPDHAGMIEPSKQVDLFD